MIESEKRMYAFIIHLLTEKYKEKELIRIIKQIYKEEKNDRCNNK